MHPDLLPHHLRRLAPQYVHLHHALDRAKIKFYVPSFKEQQRDLLPRVQLGVEERRHQYQLVDTEAGLTDRDPQLAHLHLVGNLIISRLVHPFGSPRLDPDYYMIFDAELLTPMEVELP